MTYRQSNFAGGMSAIFDSTKTPTNQYRLALNGRVRRNAFEGRFEYVYYDTPSGLHQTVFARDSDLFVVVGGLLQKVLLPSTLAVPVTQEVPLSSTAEYIYHLAVPAPNNYIVNGQYKTEVSTYPEVVILQDGLIQPLLLLPDGTIRSSKTYQDWSYDAPEYVPIGLFMASSGNKSFIVSPDRKKIYQSVSGRQLDFVLDFDDAGNKRGDASTTALVVATNTLTAAVPSQNGGLITFTEYNSYAFDPDSNRDLFFGEVPLIPRDLFPVGAVNHLSFSFANGESIFVNAAGIQSFNQVMQEFRASNNTPFGAPIVDYLSLPLTTTASATVDDYTFISVATIFGPGILVFDNRLSVFVAIDLTPGLVKEFAVLSYNGLKRLFFITATGLYELPIYSGQRTTAHLYLGEFSSDEANRTSRVVGVNLGFNDVRATGNIVCELWTDKKLNNGLRTQQELTYTGAGDFSGVPRRYPLASEVQTSALSFDLCDSFNGYANGVFISIAADARLVSATIDIENQATAAALPVLDLIPVTEIYLGGGLLPDETLPGEDDVSLTQGDDYVFWTPSVASSFMNGGSRVRTESAPKAIPFTARANLAAIDANSTILSYSTAAGLFPTSATAIVLGQFGGQSLPHPLAAVLKNRAVDYRMILSPDAAGSVTQAKKFFAETGSIQRDVISTEFVNFYLISFIVDSATAVVNSSGIMPSTPADMTVTGDAYKWLAGQIAKRAGDGKFNIVCFALPPYVEEGDYAPGFVTLRWDFNALGIQAVITGGGESYRTFIDGVHYIVSSSANAAASTPAVLKLSCTQAHIQGEFVNGSTSYDGFTITK